MQVIQIDDVDAQPAQARLTTAFHPLWTSVDHGGWAAAGRRHEAEFARQHHLVPPVPNRAPDENFVRAPAVGIRGIEERDTKVDRAVERPDRFVVVAGTVTLRHSHAAEPD